MSKRKRTTEECMSGNTEHMSPENARRGESVVGGTLRLNIASCLQPIEAEILDTLLEAVKLSKSGTVVRVAGGWVRDKLLGLEVREHGPDHVVFSRINQLFARVCPPVALSLVLSVHLWSNISLQTFVSRRLA